MSKVAIITEQQKEQLVDKLIQPSMFFNPIKDGNDNWIISEEEIINSIYSENDWIKDLVISDFVPPVVSTILLNE